MTLTPEQLQDVADTVWAESRGESLTGQIAVAHVIHNRLSVEFGGACTPSEVVRADAQFSCWNEVPEGANIEGIDRDSDQYRNIEAIVRAVWAGDLADPTGGADHYLNLAETATYYADGIPQDHWSNIYPETLTIENHTFYRGNRNQAREAMATLSDTNAVNAIINNHRTAAGERTIVQRGREAVENGWNGLQQFGRDFMEDPMGTLQDNWFGVLLGAIGLFAAFKVIGGIFNFFGGSVQGAVEEQTQRIGSELQSGVRDATSELIEQTTGLNLSPAPTPGASAGAQPQR